MPAAALEIHDLVKRYQQHTAVESISLELQPGRMLALLGTNGAGKTTAIEICEGFRQASSGTVRVLGLDPVNQSAQLRPRVGVMLQDGVGGYTGAKAREMLELFASYAAHPLPSAELLDLVGLSEVAERPVKRLSGGQQQRLSLAMALVGRPELVFLDEPTTGMDPQARRTAWELLRRLRAAGVSVVLTTHYLDEAEELADDVVVLHEGRVVARGTPEELTRSDSAGKIRFSAPPALAVAELQAALPPGSRVREQTPGAYIIEAPMTPQLLAAVTTWCAQRGIMPEGLSVQRRRLEDVFLDLTAPAGEVLR